VGRVDEEHVAGGKLLECLDRTSWTAWRAPGPDRSRPAGTGFPAAAGTARCRSAWCHPSQPSMVSSIIALSSRSRPRRSGSAAGAQHACNVMASAHDTRGSRRSSGTGRSAAPGKAVRRQVGERADNANWSASRRSTAAGRASVSNSVAARRRSPPWRRTASRMPRRHPACGIVFECLLARSTSSCQTAGPGVDRQLTRLSPVRCKRSIMPL